MSATVDTRRSDIELDRLVADTNKLVAESSRLQAEHLKLAAEQNKFNAEAAKLNRDRFFIPVVAGAAFFGATLAALVPAVLHALATAGGLVAR